jgi:hypothetical protein
MVEAKGPDLSCQHAHSRHVLDLLSERLGPKRVNASENSAVSNHVHEVAAQSQHGGAVASSGGGKVGGSVLPRGKKYATSTSVMAEQQRGVMVVRCVLVGVLMVNSDNGE